MKTNARITIDTRRTRLDGLCPIRISVTSHGKRVYIPTGVACAPQSFNRKGGANGITWIKGEAAKNRQLLKLLTETQARATDGATLEQLKRQGAGTATTYQAATAGRQAVPALVSTLEQLATLRSGNTRASYLQTARKVARYYPNDIALRDFSRAHLETFVRAESETLCTNSIAHHLKNIKAAYYFAIDSGAQIVPPFRRFPIKHEPTRKRALTLRQLDALRAYHGTPQEETARDLFLLSLYLIGINPVDLLNLKPSNLESGYIYYNRRKTGHYFEIEVHPVARDIIARYKGKKHLLQFCDTWNDYTQFARRVNGSLHKIGKQLPGCPVDGLTLYYARHTWATIGAFLDIPDNTLSQALGHQANATTEIYINRDTRKINQANALVLNYILHHTENELLKAQ